jgi:hypothetical protein
LVNIPTLPARLHAPEDVNLRIKKVFKNKYLYNNPAFRTAALHVGTIAALG